MSRREIGKGDVESVSLRCEAGRQVGENETQDVLAPRRDPLAQVVCRLGDKSCAQAHAATLNRDTAFRPSRGAGSLLRLQRQYGNRYVQRVLAQTREDDLAGSDARPSPGTIQRWEFGEEPVPALAGWTVVPEDPPEHRARVRAAMAILERVAGNRRCQQYFQDNCTAGLGEGELATALADARVYYMSAEGELFGESETRTTAPDPRNVAYNRTAYRIGAWEIAATLLHEMFHTCILGVIPNEEITAETAVETCRLYTPWILEVDPRSGPVGSTVMIRGFGFGPSQAAVDRVTFNGVDAGRADSWVLSNADSMVRVQIRVPAGATSGPIIVYNNGIPSNRANFTVTV